MKKMILALTTAIGLITASTAMAGGNSWYVLGAAGQASNDTSKSEMDALLVSVGGTGFASTYEKPTMYKLQLGYEINKNLAVEGGYVGSNNATYTATGGNLAGPISVSADYSGWNLAAVGIAPINDKFSLLGRLGVADIKVKGTVTGPGGTASASGSKADFLVGVGMKYDITSTVFTRLDLDSYKFGDSASSSRGSVWTIGLGVKF